MFDGHGEAVVGVWRHHLVLALNCLTTHIYILEVEVV